MRQLSSLIRFSGLLLVIWAGLAHADPIACPGHLLGGTSPVALKAEIRTKTTILCSGGYAVLYSGVLRLPVWSAEHLTKAEAAAAEPLDRPRVGYRIDERLPEDQRSRTSDFKGYDVGHMAPSGDMDTEALQIETFKLSNMAPQTACLNRITWSAIEAAVRKLAEDTGEVYVVTGPILAANDFARPERRVVVPAAFFKAIFVPARGFAAAYRAVNDDSLTWVPVSISQLITEAGIDPFPVLSDDVKKSRTRPPGPGPHRPCGHRRR